MAPIKVDVDKIREFKDSGSFYKWLGKTMVTLPIRVREA